MYGMPQQQMPQQAQAPQRQQTPRPYAGMPGGGMPGGGMPQGPQMPGWNSGRAAPPMGNWGGSQNPGAAANQNALNAAHQSPGGMGGPPPWAQQQHQAPPWMGQSMGWGGGQGYGQGMPQRQGMGYAQLGQMMQPQQRPPMGGGGYGQGGFPQMDPRMAMRG